MKLYQVTYEEYYDDFSCGGTNINGSWLYQSKENAIKKVAEIKPEIYEEFKVQAEELEYVKTIDTLEEYAIREKSSIGCSWGSSVYITEIETED